MRGERAGEAVEKGGCGRQQSPTAQSLLYFTTTTTISITTTTSTTGILLFFLKYSSKYQSICL